MLLRQKYFERLHHFVVSSGIEGLYNIFLVAGVTHFAELDKADIHISPYPWLPSKIDGVFNETFGVFIWYIYFLNKKCNFVQD